MIVYRVDPKAVCTRCGHPTDAAADLEQTYAPQPGDVTVCFSCQNVMRFYKKGKHLSVRAATAKFLMDLPKESRDAIEALQKDIRQFLEANPEEEDDEQS